MDFNPALDFVVGSGDVAPSIDAAVRGMELGERREVQVSEEEPMFGEYVEEKRPEVFGWVWGWVYRWAGGGNWVYWWVTDVKFGSLV